MNEGLNVEPQVAAGFCLGECNIDRAASRLAVSVWFFCDRASQHIIMAPKRKPKAAGAG